MRLTWKCTHCDRRYLLRRSCWDCSRRFMLAVFYRVMKESLASQNVRINLGGDYDGMTSEEREMRLRRAIRRGQGKPPGDGTVN